MHRPPRVRLRSAETGAVEATFVEEVEGAAPLEPVAERLAARILEGAAGVLARAAPPEAEEAPAAPPEPADVAAAAEAVAGNEAPEDDGKRAFGLSFESEGPIAINAEELEAIQKDGRRHLVFRGNVRVSQGDLKLRSQRLEATYPPGSSQPERLVAEKDVHVVRGIEEARCDRAVYDRARDRLTCRGHARLTDGSNVVEGETIEFDLASEKVTIQGGASVVLQPDEDEESGEGADADAATTAAREPGEGEDAP